MLGLTHIQDFYMLEALKRHMAEQEMSHKNETLLAKVTDAFETLVPDLAKAMYLYLYVSSMGEARHASREVAQDYYIRGLYHGPRSLAMEHALNFDPKKCLPVLDSLFRDQPWESSSYGGKKWADIVKGAMLYGTVPDAAFVDHVVDLQHNGGTAFSKMEARDVIHFNPSFYKDETNSWLNWKKHGDMLHPSHSVHLTSKVKSLYETIIGDNWNIYTYDENWEWTEPETGEGVIQLVRKLTPGRTIKKESDNELTLPFMRAYLKELLKGMVGTEEVLVLNIGTKSQSDKLIKNIYDQLMSEFKKKQTGWLVPQDEIASLVEKAKPKTLIKEVMKKQQLSIAGY